MLTGRLNGFTFRSMRMLVSIERNQALAQACAFYSPFLRVDDCNGIFLHLLEFRLMSAKRPILLRLSIALAVLYLLGTVFGGIGLGEIALHPASRPIRESEERNAEAAAQRDSVEFRDSELVAEDGTFLRAWYMRPQQASGNAVILLHGVSDNRLGMYGYARWLLQNHYSVLLPDARHHGSSGGLSSYGINEASDIHRWVDWIETNEHPHCVYGLGESMGAAELLQSLTRERRFCAVVAESPFATFREVAYARFGRPFHTGPWLGRTFFRPTVDVGFLYVHIRYGLNMEDASPEQAIAAAGFLSYSFTA